MSIPDGTPYQPADDALGRTRVRPLYLNASEV